MSDENFLMVVPVAGKIVRDPANPFIVLKEGEPYRVPANQFWWRRLRDGDCVEVKEKEEKPQESEKKIAKNKSLKNSEGGQP